MTTCRKIADNCDVATSEDDLVFFNRREPDGILNPYVEALDGFNGTGSPLLGSYDGHRGVEDVRSGKVLFSKAVGNTRAMSIAEQGKGVNNVLKVFDMDSGYTWDLMDDLEAQGRFGVMWAKFNADASKVCWSQLRQPSSLAHPAGTWELRVADVTAEFKLANERAWTPPVESFVETYGWEPDVDRIVFASEYGATESPSWANAQLWSVLDDLSFPPERITQPFLKPTWCWSGRDGDMPPSWCKPPQQHPYHEFCNWLPDGQLVTSIVRETKGNGMDLWAMGDDGTNRQRLTWFGGQPSLTGFKQVDTYPPPAYTNVLGGVVVIPGYPTKLLIGTSGTLGADTITCWEITLDV